VNFKHPDNIVALVGHTRHSTQGSEKKNCNNHPFSGKCNNGKFVLAHNGIISNDTQLRKQYRMPKTKIETDSYIAVQLLEYKKILDEESIKFMAEAVKGSFSFSVLDTSDNLWLVKGDSPLHIIHLPELKMYVYASTEEILWKALVGTDMFAQLKKGSFEIVKIYSGDILKIQPNGNITTYDFNYDSYRDYFFRDWWEYNDYWSGTGSYIDDLKSVAAFEGINPNEIDTLVENGFSQDEIEEYIYYT